MKRLPPNMRRINTTITDLEFDALQHLSSVTGLAFAELLRRAIDAYVRAPDVTRPSPVLSTNSEESP